ncbi:hypothetical protein V8F20_005572, partial [Naviculisporaceae sp. PSN 640]
MGICTHVVTWWTVVASAQLCWYPVLWQSWVDETTNKCCPVSGGREPRSHWAGSVAPILRILYRQCQTQRFQIGNRLTRG